MVLLCGVFQVGSVLSQHDGDIATEFWKGAWFLIKSCNDFIFLAFFSCISYCCLI